MIGAIAGDVIGSRFERHPIKSKEFDLFTEDCRFTDDTVLTVAVADSLVNGIFLQENFHKYANLYPRAGWGATFAHWARKKDYDPYNSYANGSAMRVSPVAWFCSTLEETEILAEKTSEVTHNHPVGVEGARAVAAAIFLARHNASKDDIRDYIEKTTSYNLSRSLDEIRPSYKFELKADLSVPEAIISFLEAENFEDTIRNAISLGGDADTQACIAGAIAEVFFGIPDSIRFATMRKLDAFLLRTVIQFKQFLRRPEELHETNSQGSKQM